jgi:hypothetical protein
MGRYSPQLSFNNSSRLSSKPHTEATNETATGQQFPSIHFRDKRIVRGPKK